MHLLRRHIGPARLCILGLCVAMSGALLGDETRAQTTQNQETRNPEPFYKGKRLTLLINFAAGGPTDVEGRVFAKHLAKHIGAQIIVQNMDGAGGVVGAAYLGEVAPKDGTVAGYLSGTSWIYV